MWPLSQQSSETTGSTSSLTVTTPSSSSSHQEPNITRHNFQEGMKAVTTWMKKSCLKLNSEKTEVLILGSTHSTWDDTWWPPAISNPDGPRTKSLHHTRLITHDKPPDQRHILGLLQHPPHTPKNVQMDPIRMQKNGHTLSSVAY